jgi:hypothetical protein
MVTKIVTTNMNTSNIENENWESCEAGSLQRIKQDAEFNRRRRFIVSLAVVPIGYGLYKAGSLLIPQHEGYLYGGLYCSQVIDLFDDDALRSLDTKTKNKFDEHLRLCTPCAMKYYEYLRDNQAQGSIG